MLNQVLKSLRSAGNAYHNQIKGVTHNANQVGHEAYTAASKKFRGWDVVPGHETYRMKQVFANPEYSPLT